MFSHLYPKRRQMSSLAETDLQCVFFNLLEFLDPEAGRGGLKETPKRMAKAWLEWTQGYDQDPKDVFKVFEDGSEGYDEMILVRGIPFYSHCEHHLAPFFGVGHIAYIPNGKIVGLSKLSRVLDIFARRLQVQERLTRQVANAIDEHLGRATGGHRGSTCSGHRRPTDR